MFRQKTSNALVVGSGNLSYTGLNKGVEAGASIYNLSNSDWNSLSNWFNTQWKTSTPFNEIEETYDSEFHSRKNQNQPVPTEDDVEPESGSKRGHLTSFELKKLKICPYLWIQAGNLHFNRGPGRPGNQLMLKRNTRAFFGFPVEDLNPDSSIGSISITYKSHVRDDCPMRFSNNSMDVLTLPIPESEGPEAYDKKTICFERIGIRRFSMTIGSRREVSKWKRRSTAINASFKMNSGREWGVF